MLMFAVQAPLTLTTGAVPASVSGPSRLHLSTWESQWCKGRAARRMLSQSQPLRSRNHLVPYAITQASSSSKAVCSEQLQDQDRQCLQTQPMRRLLHMRPLRKTSRQKTLLEGVLPRSLSRRLPSRVRALQGPQTQASTLQACLHFLVQKEAAHQGSSKQQHQKALRGRPALKDLHLDSLCLHQQSMSPRLTPQARLKVQGARMTPWTSSRSLLVTVPRARQESRGEGVLQPSLLRRRLLARLLPSNAQGTQLPMRSTHLARL